MTNYTPSTDGANRMVMEQVTLPNGQHNSDNISESNGTELNATVKPSPLTYSILANSSFDLLFPPRDTDYNRDLAMALFKAEMEYQEIKSLINLHRHEAIGYIMDSSLGGSNRAIRKDTANGCIPFKRNAFKIRCSADGTNCQCPDGYVPCSHNKVMAGYSQWKTALVDVCSGSKRGDILIVGKLFNVYNCDGVLVDRKGVVIGPKSEKIKDEELCDLCDMADVILCRRKTSLCEVTQWSEWSGCSRPCGPGTQQRFRIFLNDECEGEYNEDTRNCQLGECPQRIPYSSCRLMKLPENDNSTHGMYDATIYGCYCPMQGYIACSAEEALSNEGSWMEDFLKHRDNYIDSLNYRRLFPKGLERKHLNHLSSSYKVLLRGGVVVDGSMAWSIASEFNLYGLCRPGAPVLCRENVDYEMVQGSSFAQFAFKPSHDNAMSRLSSTHYSIFLALVGVLSLLLYILSKMVSIRKLFNPLKNKFKQS
ncbi:hypothetical protein BmR1_04g09041 [Babesia microti strain RI]|uniref:Uncharacterized protein n=2 Tax=Babesia microti TaxID=5868 RepID=A0A1N6LYA1_BABMR|nr:hypothetical protein BmR1_04g09041 [Babesia microti strain RI]SIO73859.1 hypothetical protein BmR1_04g09041 [Babesia microti strain RI]|eukprot:XP_012650392.2 hypothetical protein BmR1_04g09041 [Babesia microti strain RI]